MNQAMKVVFSVLGSFLFLSAFSNPSNEWPKRVIGADGSEIKIYSIQPESLEGNQLKAKAAVSVLEKGKDEPIFGTTWMLATLSENGSSRQVTSVKVPNLKLPENLSASRVNYLKTTLETQLPKLDIRFEQNYLQERLNNYAAENKLQNGIKHTAPNIYYTTKPTMLVVIDGAPRLEKNEDWGVEFVVNTPYTIVRTNNRFYLEGAGVWYQSVAATGPYAPVRSVPSVLERIKKEIQAEQEKQSGYNDLDSPTEQNSAASPQEVIVSTEPAELIQTQGEPQFVPIEGTELLYAENSANDIFVDVSSQKYYVLLAGRWYYSTSGLKGQWKYSDPPELPADFAKIPEGSPKDHVLASVPGTPEAREAILDAQVPQTAKVDRQKATADIQYDGAPRFDDVEGTNLQYAQNTSATVLRYGNRYYAVDNGVWFESASPQGPWVVATTRPAEVELIPPSSPVYNVKYVYIYDVTPTYVYMGYTPGYLNTFVCGPTIVYGTGYYYRPWYGRYYFPRPWTWGFNMWYNPWTGWSFGINIHFGWFNTTYYRPWHSWCGGWWGPRIYRPAFGWYTRPHAGGYYSHAHYTHARNTYITINQTTNIYRNRTAIVTHDRHRVPDRMRPGYASNGRPGAVNRPRRNEGRPNGRTGINNDTRPGRNEADQNGRPGYNNGTRPGRNQSDQSGRPGYNNGTRPGRNQSDQNVPPPTNNGSRREGVTTRPITPTNPGSNSTAPGRTERPVIRTKPTDPGSGNRRSEARPQQPTRRYEPSQNRSSGNSERRAPQRQERRNSGNQDRRNG